MSQFDREAKTLTEAAFEVAAMKISRDEALLFPSKRVIWMPDDLNDQRTGEKVMRLVNEKHAL